MSDDIEFTGDQAGIDRREIIKRGAILGGVVWAAPVIQSIGIPAFAATPTPVTTPPEDQDMSFIRAVVTCNDTTYRVNYEDDGGWEDDPGPPFDHPQCSPGGWTTDGIVAENGGQLGLQVYVDDNGQWVLFVPESCTLVDAKLWSGSDGCSGRVGTVCAASLPAGSCYVFPAAN